MAIDISKRAAKDARDVKEEKKSSVQAAIVRDIIARMTADRMLGPKLQKGEIRKKLVEPAWKCPSCFHMTRIDLPDCLAELLSLAQNPNMGRVILQLHGGGYIGAMRNKYRSFAGLYNELGRGINVCRLSAVQNSNSRRLRRRRACPGTVSLFKRPWNRTAGRTDSDVAVDGSDGRRRIL